MCVLLDVLIFILVTYSIPVILGFLIKTYVYRWKLLSKFEKGSYLHYFILLIISPSLSEENLCFIPILNLFWLGCLMFALISELFSLTLEKPLSKLNKAWRIYALIDKLVPLPEEEPKDYRSSHQYKKLIETATYEEMYEDHSEDDKLAGLLGRGTRS